MDTTQRRLLWRLVDLTLSESGAARARAILVLEAIDRVNRELGTTTAVITHNMVIGSMADRTIYIADGSIARIEPNAHRASPRELAW